MKILFADSLQKYAEQMVSGPGIDMLINTIHSMLGLGAPTERNDIGFSQTHYPLMQAIFSGKMVGMPLTIKQALYGINGLGMYRRTQVQNFPDIKKLVDIDIAKSTGEVIDPTSLQGSGKIVVYKGPALYNKQCFKIPEFTGQRAVNALIKPLINDMLNKGDRRFRLDNWGNIRVKDGFAPSSQYPDSYDVLPDFIPQLTQVLNDSGYDTTQLLQFQQGLIQPQSSPATSINKKISARFDNSRVIINFNGFPGKPFVEGAKELGFRYQGKPANDWALFNPSANILDKFARLAKKNQYDATEVEAIIQQLGGVTEEPEQTPQNEEITQPGQKIKLKVRNVTKETGGRWHLGISFLKKGSPEGDMLKEILKYSFCTWINWGLKDPTDAPPAHRTVNTTTWETFLAGDYREYGFLYKSLNQRNFDTTELVAIMNQLTSEGLLKKEIGAGRLDGFKDKNAFMAKCSSYKLTQEDGTPFEFYNDQKESIYKMYTNRSMLKGDETGAGKTAQSIIAADMRMNVSGGRCVIITRLGPKDQWGSAIQRFIPQDAENISDDPMDKKKWTVMHYDEFSVPSTRKILTEQLMQQVASGEIQCIILDECHAVKNESNRTENIQKITEKCPFVWGLSATVVANKPVDVYNQLKAANHPLARMDWNKFAIEFGGMEWVDRTVKWKDKLTGQQKSMRRKILQMKDIEEVLKSVNKLKMYLYDQGAYDALSKKQLREDMPDQIIEQEDSKVDLNNVYASVGAKMETYKDEELAVSAMLAFRDAIAEHKAPATAAKAIEILQKGEKIIVFTAFTTSKDILRNNIQKYLGVNGKCGEISGAVTGAKRKKFIRDFKDPNSQLKAIVITIRAGGTGIDFPNIANTALVNDFEWSVADDEQMAGRNYRINSKENAYLRYMIAPNTPDVDNYKQLNDKKVTANVIHKMSQTQDDLLSKGHRTGSKELSEVEKQLNAAGKKMFEMEDEENVRNVQLTVGKRILAELRSRNINYNQKP